MYIYIIILIYIYMISKEANNQLTRWIRSVSRQRAGYPPSSVHWSLERHHLDPPRISMGDLQDPKMEVPTISKAYFLGLCQWISPQNMTLYGTVPPFQDPEIPIEGYQRSFGARYEVWFLLHQFSQLRFCLALLARAAFLGLLESQCLCYKVI